VSPVAIVGMTIVQMIAIGLMLRRARWTDFKPIGLPNVRALNLSPSSAVGNGN
jgi:hypothetical protein